ncbi:unnamed protein product, partial [Mesorhabditis spiculigera]
MARIFVCVILAVLICETVALPIKSENEEINRREKRQMWGQNNAWGRNWDYKFGLNRDMQRAFQAGPMGAYFRNGIGIDGEVKLNMRGINQQMFSFG